MLDSMKRRRLGPRLPNYYFQGKGELPFLSTFADKMETCGIFEAQRYIPDFTLEQVVKIMINCCDPELL